MVYFCTAACYVTKSFCVSVYIVRKKQVPNKQLYPSGGKATTVEALITIERSHNHMHAYSKITPTTFNVTYPLKHLKDCSLNCVPLILSFDYHDAFLTRGNWKTGTAIINPAS